MPTEIDQSDFFGFGVMTLNRKSLKLKSYTTLLHLPAQNYLGLSLKKAIIWRRELEKLRPMRSSAQVGIRQVCF